MGVSGGSFHTQGRAGARVQAAGVSGTSQGSSGSVWVTKEVQSQASQVVRVIARLLAFT